MLSPLNNRVAFQLRGMATEPDSRGLGLGTQLLEWATQHIARSQYVWHYWCNARKPAIGFYQKLGWNVDSDEFDIPTAGPHVKMSKFIAS
jgi:GNAT superfamily N-acetyltransferase